MAWYVNDVSLSTMAHNVTNRSAGWSVPAKNGANLKVPGKHGAFWLPNKTFDEGLLSLSMWALGSRDGFMPRNERAQDVIRDNLDKLSAIFGETHRLLKVESRDESGAAQYGLTNLVTNPRFAERTPEETAPLFSDLAPKSAPTPTAEGTKPTVPVITAVSPSQTVTSLPVVVRWNYDCATAQTYYQIRLYAGTVTNLNGTELQRWTNGSAANYRYLTGVDASNNPYDFENGKSYTLAVQAKNATTWSDWIYIPFTVDLLDITKNHFTNPLADITTSTSVNIGENLYPDPFHRKYASDPELVLVDNAVRFADFQEVEVPDNDWLDTNPITSQKISTLARSATGGFADNSAYLSVRSNRSMVDGNDIMWTRNWYVIGSPAFRLRLRSNIGSLKIKIAAGDTPQATPSGSYTDHKVGPNKTVTLTNEWQDVELNASDFPSTGGSYDDHRRVFLVFRAGQTINVANGTELFGVDCVMAPSFGGSVADVSPGPQWAGKALPFFSATCGGVTASSNQYDPFYRFTFRADKRWTAQSADMYGAIVHTSSAGPVFHPYGTYGGTATWRMTLPDATRGENLRIRMRYKCTDANAVVRLLNTVTGESLEMSMDKTGNPVTGGGHNISGTSKELSMPETTNIQTTTGWALEFECPIGKGIFPAIQLESMVVGDSPIYSTLAQSTFSGEVDNSTSYIETLEAAGVESTTGVYKSLQGNLIGAWHTDPTEDEVVVRTPAYTPARPTTLVHVVADFSKTGDHATLHGAARLRYREVGASEEKTTEVDFVVTDTAATTRKFAFPLTSEVESVQVEFAWTNPHLNTGFWVSRIKVDTNPVDPYTNEFFYWGTPSSNGVHYLKETKTGPSATLVSTATRPGYTASQYHVPRGDGSRVQFWGGHEEGAWAQTQFSLASGSQHLQAKRVRVSFTLSDVSTPNDLASIPHVFAELNGSRILLGASEVYTGRYTGAFANNLVSGTNTLKVIVLGARASATAIPLGETPKTADSYYSMPARFALSGLEIVPIAQDSFLEHVPSNMAVPVTDVRQSKPFHRVQIDRTISTITPDTITPDRVNIASNPSFEGNLNQGEFEGLPSGNASVSLDTAWAAVGTSSVRIDPKVNGNTDTTFYPYAGLWTDSQKELGATPGTTFTIGATIHLEAPQTGTLNKHARTIRINLTDGTTNTYSWVLSTPAPNVAGDHRVSVTFTVPDWAQGMNFNLCNGSNTGPVWWDALTVEHGATSGEYFDGDSEGYQWAGKPHNSPTVSEIVQGIQTSRYPYITKETQEWQVSPSEGKFLLHLDQNAAAAGGASLSKFFVYTMDSLSGETGPSYEMLPNEARLFDVASFWGSLPATDTREIVVRATSSPANPLSTSGTAFSGLVARSYILSGESFELPSAEGSQAISQALEMHADTNVPPFNKTTGKVIKGWTPGTVTGTSDFARLKSKLLPAEYVHTTETAHSIYPELVTTQLALSKVIGWEHVPYGLARTEENNRHVGLTIPQRAGAIILTSPEYSTTDEENFSSGQVEIYNTHPGDEVRLLSADTQVWTQTVSEARASVAVVWHNVPITPGAPLKVEIVNQEDILMPAYSGTGVDRMMVLAHNAQLAAPPVYFDGDTAGGVWNGTPPSTSVYLSGARQCWAEVQEGIDMTSMSGGTRAEFVVNMVVPDVFWEDTFDTDAAYYVERWTENSSALTTSEIVLEQFAESVAPITDARITVTVDGTATTGGPQEMTLTDRISGAWIKFLIPDLVLSEATQVPITIDCTRYTVTAQTPTGTKNLISDTTKGPFNDFFRITGSVSTPPTLLVSVVPQGGTSFSRKHNNDMLVEVKARRKYFVA